MKNFSIEFSLSKSDYKKFYNTVYKTLLAQRLKLAAISLTVSFVFAVLSFYSLAVTTFFLMFILFFMADIINRTYIMRMNDKSKIGKRKTTIDFYNDHFEIINYPDQYFKGKSERHYPLDTVKMVLENREYIYFKLEDFTTLIIPKRFIEESAYVKIKNMIDDLYPDRFLEE